MARYSEVETFLRISSRNDLTLFIIDTVASFIGSMLALAVWFHWDLDGWWEVRRHTRLIRKGQKKDQK